MAIPMAAPGGSSTAPHVTAISEHHGTIFHGKQAVALIVRVLACLAEDFLPFVNPNLSHFLSHLHYRLTTNPACIIARMMTQHGHQDTQESVAKIA
jgi:hypothetical protein